MAPNWLAQLAPAHAPAPASWWPPAPGWWVLALLAVLGAALALRWWRTPQRARRRRALAELRRIGAADLDSAEAARAIESLLRRYALATFGRSGVARLSGSAWLQFVAAHGGVSLGGEAGSALLRAAFGGPAIDRREQWLAGAEAFVRAELPP